MPERGFAGVAQLTKLDEETKFFMGLEDVPDKDLPKLPMPVAVMREADGSGATVMTYSQIAKVVDHLENSKDPGSQRWLAELKKAKEALQPYADGKSPEGLQSISKASEFTAPDDEQKIRKALSDELKGGSYTLIGNDYKGAEYNSKTGQWDAVFAIGNKTVHIPQDELAERMEFMKNEIVRMPAGYSTADQRNEFDAMSRILESLQNEPKKVAEASSSAPAVQSEPVAKPGLRSPAP